MGKMTDYELWSYGFKEQKDTWWGKRIAENEKAVDNGEYGEVLKKWFESDGWCDGVKTPHYIVLRSKYEPVVINVNESGVFQKLKGGGWGSIKKINN
jgi:hypothetical protein